MKKSFFIILIFCLLESCGSNALNLKKKSSTDEFLVEKKSPLVLPPDYGKLPMPGNEQIDDQLPDDKIKDLVTGENKNMPQENKKKIKSTSITRSILEKIK